MKWIWSVIWLLAACQTAIGLECFVQPNPVVNGETVEVTIRSDRARPEVQKTPAVDGAEWVGNVVRTGYSSSYSTSGGRQTVYSATLLLRPRRSGVVRIPPIAVSVDGKITQTDPVDLNVLDAPAPAADEGKMYFGRFLLPENRRFYVGEEIPFTIEIFTRRGEDIQMSYPQVKVPRSVFREYRQENPQNPRFDRPGRVRLEVVDGTPYQVQPLYGAFRPLGPGKITPEAYCGLAIAKRDQNRRRSLFDDDFFASFGAGRQVEERQLDFAAAHPIEILPLPPPPADTVSLGLVGNWRIQCRLENAANPRVGDVLTLIADLTGAGSGEALTAPSLAIPGFRIYPPEIRRITPGRMQIEYQLIPLRPGNAEIIFNPAVFDPATGKYQVAGFKQQVTIAAAPRSASGVTTAIDSRDNASPAPAEPAAPAAPTLHYLKTRPHAPVSKTPWIIALFIGGPVVFAAAEWLHHRRNRMARDEAWLRRRRARARRNPLCRELLQASDGAFNDKVLTEVVPLLADCCVLPPGSTAAEVAERIPDPELAAYIRECGMAAYQPDGTAAAVDRKRFVRALKKMLAVAVVLTAGMAAAGDFAAGNAAYDAGDFATARSCYDAAMAADVVNAAGYYNLGCAAFMDNDLPLALASFETARRLHPGDPDTMDNLNMTRTRLGLPPADNVDSPGALLRFVRDAMTPAAWLLAAAIVWFTGFLLLIWWRRADRMTRGVVAGVWCVLLVLALTAAWSAWRGPYARNRAVAAAGGAEMRLLPTANAAVEGRVPAGQEVCIREWRGDRALIEWNNRSGWVERRALHRIFR